MARFTIPRDVYFGQGTVDELKNLNGNRAAIVIGGDSVKKNGALEKVEKNLKDAGMETILIEGVEADPSVKTVMRGVEVMNQFKPDWIIGLSSSILGVVPLAPLFRRSKSSVKSLSEIANPAGHPSIKIPT